MRAEEWTPSFLIESAQIENRPDTRHSGCPLNGRSFQIEKVVRAVLMEARSAEITGLHFESSETHGSTNFGFRSGTAGRATISPP